MKFRGIIAVVLACGLLATTVACGEELEGNLSAGQDAGLEPDSGVPTPDLVMDDTADDVGDEDTAEPDPEPEPTPVGLRATISTSLGDIIIELEPEKSPVTVENFVRYANEDYFSGLIFHRVIPGFMIQGGGFAPGMAEKQTTHPPIVNEAVASGLPNLRGTIAMARTNDPDSATSQFFINLVDNGFLDPSPENPSGYAVFGTVVEGMDVVSAIGNVATTTVGQFQDVPVEDVMIQSITIDGGE